MLSVTGRQRPGRIALRSREALRHPVTAHLRRRGRAGSLPPPPARPVSVAIAQVVAAGVRLSAEEPGDTES